MNKLETCWQPRASESRRQECVLVDLGTDLRCSLSGLCERTSVRTAHAAAQDLEHGVAGGSIERDRILY